NEELNKLHKDVKIVINNKICQLEWLGHITRITDDRVPKRVLNAKLRGKRKESILWLRRYYDVQSDIKKMGFKERWDKSKNRSE
ncbi:hypothetical protein C0J52_19497, partial [Blattella germanica]